MVDIKKGLKDVTEKAKEVGKEAAEKTPGRDWEGR